jgi:hypothetical protein
MTGELIIFPVRFGVRLARLALRGGLKATELTLELATGLVRSVTPDGDSADVSAPSAPSDFAGSPPVERPRPAPRRETTEATTTTRAAEPPRAAEPRPAAEPPPAAEPAHVSEEATVVEEFAEPGAEEGAGAEVTVDEPWEGYSRTAAKDVIARVRDAGLAELAAVQLYETAHARRATVIAAVQRELRAKSGRGAAAG